ncbi:hypothetical protein J6590_060814 [Homalodisca vitripennis]|nr:hypothetical protein J6590_060814 [Homalodisca vitripennis]
MQLLFFYNKRITGQGIYPDTVRYAGETGTFPSAPLQSNSPLDETIGIIPLGWKRPNR